MAACLEEEETTPEPIVKAIIDSFTHVSNSFASEESQDNILLARNNLSEATFLCFEVIVTAIATEIAAVCENAEATKFCIDSDYSEFNRKHAEFLRLGKTAKSLEREKLGETCIKAINTYNAAIKLGQELQRLINWSKLEDFNQEVVQKIEASKQEISNKNKIIETLSNQLSKHTIRTAIALLIIGAIISAIISAIITPESVSYVYNLTRLKLGM